MRVYEKLPERICRVIRGAFDLGGYVIDHADMAIQFRADGETLSVPICDVQDYINAWKNSGLWALHGRPDDKPAKAMSAGTAETGGLRAQPASAVPIGNSPKL